MPPQSALSLHSPQPLKLPLGVTDFGKLLAGGYTFVDKTLLIKEMIQQGAEVTLITRPRRFGKTLNLGMLQHFFAKEVNGRATAGLFDTLAIARHPQIMAKQGRHPVIFFTFKDMESDSFAAFEAKFREKLAELCRQYPQLLDSPHLHQSARNSLDALLNGTAGTEKMVYALRLLSELLYRHHGEKTVILLDEYDAPILSAFNHGFYQDLMDKFMRPLLGAALKDNSFLQQAVLTGILRITKENMFSGLNNPAVRTVLDEDYSGYFGFTEEEVSSLVRATGLGAEKNGIEAPIKDWYNGYRFGKHVIYNPWSIINCLQERGALRSYWAHTSGHVLLRKLMAEAGADFKEGLQRLIRDQSVKQKIDENLVFADLKSGSSMTLWSLLLFSGYLTAVAVERSRGKVSGELVIPNREIRYEYERIVESWFTAAPMSDATYEKMLSSLAGGDIAVFESHLREYLLTSAGLFDVGGKRPENFYHGLVLGLMAGLRDTHIVDSNRESGYGRYDVAIFPRNGKTAAGPGIVLELKKAGSSAKLREAAKAALRQIDAKVYEAELRKHKVTEIVRVGVGFWGKRVMVAHSKAVVNGRSRKRSTGKAHK